MTISSTSDAKPIAATGSYLRSSLFQWPELNTPLLAITAPCRYLLCLKSAHAVCEPDTWHTHYQHEYQVLCSKLQSLSLNLALKLGLKKLFQQIGSTHPSDRPSHSPKIHTLCCEIYGHFHELNNQEASQIALILHTLLTLEMHDLTASEQHSTQALCDQLLPWLRQVHLDEPHTTIDHQEQRDGFHFRYLGMTAALLMIIWLFTCWLLPILPKTTWAFSSTARWETHLQYATGSNTMMPTAAPQSTNQPME